MAAGSVSRSRAVGTRFVAVNVEGFDAFAEGLHKVAPDIQKRLAKSLRRIGEKAKYEMAMEASKHSTSIPRTLKVTSGRHSVSISAGGRDEPLARLYEIGNLTSREVAGIYHGKALYRTRNSKGRKAREGQLGTSTLAGGIATRKGFASGNRIEAGSLVFRHPVWERKDDTNRSAPWVNQERFPFMVPVAERMAPELEQDVRKAVELACKRLERNEQGVYLK